MSNAPPVPPKRNYKNRIGSHSQHHPELLQASSGNGLGRPHPPLQPQAPSVVVGAGHNVPRSLVAQSQPQVGLKSSSSQQHVAVPVDDDDDEYQPHGYYPSPQTRTSQIPQPNRQQAPRPSQQQQQQAQGMPTGKGSARYAAQSQQPPPPRYQGDHDHDDDDMDEQPYSRPRKQHSQQQQHHDEEEEEEPVSLQRSLKRQLSNNFKSSSSSSLLPNHHNHPNNSKANSVPSQKRNQVDDHLLYDANRVSHSQLPSYSYEEEEIEEEILDFALAEAQADVFIGEDVEIKGDFQYDGILRLDGKFQGKLITTGDLIIGPKGVLVSDIAHSIQRLWVDGGHVYGQIEVEELYVTGNALIKGDITTRYLHIYSGSANIMGRANIHPNVNFTANGPNPISLSNSRDDLSNQNKSNMQRKSVKELVHEKASSSVQTQSTQQVDPKQLIEQARLAKQAAKQRRKEAKELLKREIEAKAREQAEEVERLQQSKQGKVKPAEAKTAPIATAPEEKLDSKDIGPESPIQSPAAPLLTKGAPSMKQLTPQGSWKISTGEDTEKSANAPVPDNKPNLMDMIAEHGIEDHHADEPDGMKWDMKMHSPQKGSAASTPTSATKIANETAIRKEENPAPEPVITEKVIVAEEELKLSPPTEADVQVSDDAQKEDDQPISQEVEEPVSVLEQEAEDVQPKTDVDENNPLAQFSKLQEEASQEQELEQEQEEPSQPAEIPAQEVAVEENVEQEQTDVQQEDQAKNSDEQPAEQKEDEEEKEKEVPSSPSKEDEAS